MAISPGRAEVERIVQLLADVPEVDLERVHKLKGEIEAGTYAPDAYDTAEALIDETLFLSRPSSAGHA